MASAVDISNLALSHLGQSAEVIDINPPDGSAEAQHCARFYPMARNELLEMHPWSFATRRVALAEVVGADRPGWQYAYAKPAGCVRPLSVLGAEAFDDAVTEDYIVESSAAGAIVIYTNVEAATLRYIALVEDTTKFTPGFSGALSRLLASKLAGPIIKGVEGMRVAEAQLKIFLIELANARTSDSNSGARRTSEFVPASIRARGFRTNDLSGRGYR